MNKRVRRRLKKALITRAPIREKFMLHTTSGGKISVSKSRSQYARPTPAITRCSVHVTTCCRHLPPGQHRHRVGGPQGSSFDGYWLLNPMGQLMAPLVCIHHNRVGPVLILRWGFEATKSTEQNKMSVKNINERGNCQRLINKYTQCRISCKLPDGVIGIDGIDNTKSSRRWYRRLFGRITIVLDTTEALTNGYRRELSKGAPLPPPNGRSAFTHQPLVASHLQFVVCISSWTTDRHLQARLKACRNSTTLQWTVFRQGLFHSAIRKKRCCLFL